MAHRGTSPKSDNLATRLPGSSALLVSEVLIDDQRVSRLPQGADLVQERVLRSKTRCARTTPDLKTVVGVEEDDVTPT
jgi:hypothetical protein